MLVNARTLLLSALLASTAAFGKPTLSWTPPTDEGERPMATEVTVAPQGSDFAFKVVFNKAPWGEECKNRCANVTLFVDTDNSKTTGLQLGGSAAETGADLSINIQGARDYKESRADVLLKVKVRTFDSGAKSVEEGELVTELNNRQDAERVESDGETVYVLVDGTSATLPSGKQMRVVYHPPGQSAVSGTTTGMLSGGSSKVEVFKKGQKERSSKKK